MALPPPEPDPGSRGWPENRASASGDPATPTDPGERRKVPVRGTRRATEAAADDASKLGPDGGPLDAPDELDAELDDSGPDLTSPWPLGVFLGFATSLAANDPIRPNATLTAVLFLAGFAAGVGLWVGIVAVLGRGAAATDRAQARLTAEVDSEQVKLDAARLRLERARIERQIAALERSRNDGPDLPEGAGPLPDTGPSS